MRAMSEQSAGSQVRKTLRPLSATTVFVTHDQGEAMAASDRLAVMH